MSNSHHAYLLIACLVAAGCNGAAESNGLENGDRIAGLEARIAELETKMEDSVFELRASIDELESRLDDLDPESLARIEWVRGELDALEDAMESAIGDRPTDARVETMIDEALAAHPLDETALAAYLESWREAEEIADQPWVEERVGVYATEEDVAATYATAADLSDVRSDLDPLVALLTATDEGLGVGVEEPSAMLDVQGSLRLGDDQRPCEAEIAGALRFRGSDLDICTDSGWQTLTQPGPGSNLDVVFTNCGKEGSEGPSQAQCDAAYAGTELEGDVELHGPWGGIQKWMVPEPGSYRITATGASGHQDPVEPNVSGLGALVEGVFDFEPGQVLWVLVGQSGQQGGGGGGTFVAEGQSHASARPLLVAGGGGGASDDGPGYDAACTPYTHPQREARDTITDSGFGLGLGGWGSALQPGGGGAGYFGDGDDHESPESPMRARAFVGGGRGDTRNPGGFGGGGGGGDGGGGGGGFSGGNTGNFNELLSELVGESRASGGGSFNSGRNGVCQPGHQLDHGWVRIERLGP